MTVLARRALLSQLSGIVQTQTSTLTARVITQPVPPPDAITLLLNRATFGARQSEVEQARSAGFSAWLESQLNHTALDNTALEAAISANLPTIALSSQQIFANYGPQSGNQFVPLSELRGATLLRQIHSPRQLFEVMVEFWSNHFAVQHTDGLVQQLKTADDRAIRTNALGTFRALLNANARSPAMLFFLDNYTNIATGPNENYARELLELHTLGVNGGYTEDDIKGVARAFTGWTFDRRTYEFSFNQGNHDVNGKFALGRSLPANRGIEDGQEILDLLIAHPATASFIASKLVRRFVSDEPEAGLVTRVAAAWGVDGDIKAMLRVLFNSAEFAGSADRKARRPADFVVAALRVTEAQISGTSYLRQLNNALTAGGQVMFMWPTPDGYPDVQSHWYNTSAWISRWNYAFALVEGALDRGIVVNAQALAGSANTPVTLVDALSSRLLRRALNVSDRQILIDYARNGAGATQVLAGNELTARAREITALLLGSRYFNYR